MFNKKWERHQPFLLKEKLCVLLILTHRQVFSVTCLRYSITSVRCCTVSATLVNRSINSVLLLPVDFEILPYKQM